MIVHDKTRLIDDLPFHYEKTTSIEVVFLVLFREEGITERF